MKKKQKLNVRLLRRIQRHILEEPRRFFMDWYVAKVNPRTGRWTHCSGDDLSKVPPPCGTAHCIAGLANFFTGHKPTNSFAAELELGLTRDQADNLFSMRAWPNPFRLQYEKARGPARRAKIAAARIGHLIKTGK